MMKFQLSAIRNKKVLGMTMLETLLVMAVGVSLIVLGVRLYTVYKRDTNLLELESNIDTLFSAAVGYYHAQCKRGGLLDPAIATGSVKAINITTDLITPGYLTTPFPRPNALVDSSGPGGGYIVQFNKFLIPRTTLTCSNPPTCSSTTSTQIGTYVIWRIQVSVLMRNTSAGQLANARSFLGGQCLSSASGSPATVALCTTNPTGNYVVLDRLPSAAIHPDAGSPLWLSMPAISQFKQLYTTDPMSSLTSTNHSPEYQYFYCNG